MSARARKQPERRSPGNGARGGRLRQEARPGLLTAALAGVGRFVVRHPGAIGGVCAFAVTFSFVAANALWYQPGGHPAPILRMRTADNSLGFTATKPDPKDVTTFVIERADADQPLPEVVEITPAERPFDEVASNATAPADPVAAAIRQAEADPAVTSAVERPAPAVAQISDDLVMKIQKGLSNIAYADIAVDGLIGEKTRSAIRHFEKHYRLPVTGEPNGRVLAKLKDIGAL
ncbi:peptidoglycan-binding protein [Shinella daejeonensis]|uniref:peptidoglycan-binding domain-containing protein n=1 Tax=Shinella daejeonensis TaxID=659017 RepID=UPI0020C82DEA|nr:peptidoglycan-binding domain-containing protein [Shinella daejeonensis]MCP8897045.1 peptidoglycan-binding protein [Shinella daejeonensis]